MLKKENRLVSDFEFNITRKYGIKFSNELFNFYLLQANNYSGPVKVGIVISKKLDKRATKRNRVKRVFSEIVRNNLDKFRPNYWVVIHPKIESFEKNYEEINTQFNQTLQKIPFTN